MYPCKEVGLSGNCPYDGRVPADGSQSQPSLSTWMRDDAILLHIGVHKTGTTAIQGALQHSQEVLRDAGVLYLAAGSHFAVSMSALGRRVGWDTGARGFDRRKWLNVVREGRSHAGRCLLSSEVLCEADDVAASRVVEELGQERVQILITLRALEQLLPSTWQQYLKSGYRQPYDRWLRRVLESTSSRTTPSFWRRNDHGRLVERWGALVGPENVAVLVVDSADHQRLFRDFEELLRLPGGALKVVDALPSNRSLSAPEAETLRLFNKRMRSKMPYSTYHQLIRRGAALALVEGRRPGETEPSIVTPSWAVSRAREHGAESVRRIRALGSPIFGNVEHLTPTHDYVDVLEQVPPREVPVDIGPLLLEGAVRASRGERYGTVEGMESSSGLAFVPWRLMASELVGRVRQRLRGRRA